MPSVLSQICPGCIKSVTEYLSMYCDDTNICVAAICSLANLENLGMLKFLQQFNVVPNSNYSLTREYPQHL